MDFKDPSGFVRALFMSVGFAYPVRFVCSFGLSILIYLLISSMSIDFPGATLLRVLNDNPKLFIPSLAVLFAFWPALLSRNLRPDRMGALIDTLGDIIDKSSLSTVQKNMIWRDLANRIVSQTKADDPLSSDAIKNMARDIVKEEEQGGTDPLLPS